MDEQLPTAPDYINPALHHLLRRVEELKPDPRNAMRHPDRNKLAIGRSYERFRQQKPIVVKPDGTCVAGSGQLEQARALGWEWIAAVQFDGDDREAVAYGVADNKTALLAEWDEPNLIAALEEAGEEFWDATGFSENEITLLLDDVGGESVSGTLAQRFIVPPFSVLDTRRGEWQARKQMWVDLGIRSDLGRPENLVRGSDSDRSVYGRNVLGHDSEGRFVYGEAKSGTSIFDPVLCELAYAWFAPAAARVLDPFAGGSVRGIVAALSGHAYTGIDLSAEQVAENAKQGKAILKGKKKAEHPPPRWLRGDSHDLAELLGEKDRGFDLVFTCPPYGSLERYSDDPRDLSTMETQKFASTYSAIVGAALERLADNRFAVFIVGDYREKGGELVSLSDLTITACAQAGAVLYNEAIIVKPVGSAHLRAPRFFASGRKLARVHEHMLVFYKGDLAANPAGSWAIDTEAIERATTAAVEAAGSQQE